MSILLISNDNDYLYELLRIEGISLDRNENFDNWISNYNLLIINNFEFDIESLKKLGKFCGIGKSIILINPDNFIQKRLNLNYKEHANPYTINYKSAIITIIPYDFVKTIYTLNMGNDAVYDKNGVYRANTTSNVKETERLFPKADFLKRELVNIIQDVSDNPIPRLWYLPYKKLAGVIFTHDSDEVGDKEISKINDIDNQNNIKATTFMLLKTGSPKSWRGFKSSMQELQLHQAYFYLPNTPEKLSKLLSNLITNPITLKFQECSLHLQKYLLSKIAKTEISGVRNHGLFWHRKDNIPLWMQNAGIEFDSTLGGVSEYGYLHGTGLPYFLRMPKTYKKLNVLEFPLHIMDYIYFRYGDKCREITRNFLDNALKFNSLITFDFHHKLLSKRGILKWYLETIDYAKQKGFLINNMFFYNDFWRKKLLVETKDIKFENGRLSYRVVSNKVNGLTQILPLEFQNRKLEMIAVDSKRISIQRLKVHNRFYAMFEVGKKRDIVADYR